MDRRKSNSSGERLAASHWPELLHKTFWLTTSSDQLFFLTWRGAMKVMILMKANENAQGQVPPSPEAINAMHNYNEALIAAGILKDQVLGGLLPTKFAKRLQFSGKGHDFTVTDGPFTEAKEVVAGFALWEVKSIEEALEWARKSPVHMECTVELRPLYSPETWDPV
jgi:hypothetical protein